MSVPPPGTIIDGSSGRLQGWKDEGDRIFSIPWSGPCYGVFLDTFEEIGRDAVLWNMAVDNNYGSNPHLRMHDFDPTHDYYMGRREDRYKMHAWQSQFIVRDGRLYVRTVDGRSPDLHHCRAAVQKVGFTANGQAGLILDGVTIRHVGSFTSILNCPGVIVRNCVFEYCGGYGLEIHGSNDAVVEHCQIHGGGSGVAHGGQSAYFSNESGLRFEGNDVRHGGHGGPFGKALQRYTFRGNTFGKAQGSLLNLNYGCSDGVIEENTFEGAPWQFESLIHKEPHAGIQLIGNNNQIRRNRFLHCGVGLAIDCNETQTSNRNVIAGNSFQECEVFGIVLEGYQAGFKGRLNGNLIQSNRFDGRGQFDVRFDLPAGGSDQWGNRLQDNALPGKIQFLDGGMGDVAAMQSKFPAVMTGNTSQAPVDPPPAPTPSPEPSPTPNPSPGGSMRLYAIAPIPVQRGQTITLSGSGLGSAAFVLFYTGLSPDPGNRELLTVLSDTRATAVVPDDAVTGPIWVRDRLGVRSNELQLVIGAPQPTPTPPPTPTPEPVPLSITIGGFTAAPAGGGAFIGAIKDAAPLPPGSSLAVVVQRPDGKSASASAAIPGTPTPPPPPAPTPTPSGDLLPIPTTAGNPPTAPD